MATGRQPATAVFLHGFCENRHMWDGIINEVDGPILCIDLPGFGDEPLPEPTPSLQSWAVYLNQLFLENNVSNPILLGHSMGGYIALEYANLFPNSLSGLGLVHSHCFEDSEEKKSNRRKVIDFVEAHGIERWLPDMAESLLRSDQKPKAELLAQAFSFIESVQPESVIAGQRAMLEKRDRSAVLRSIRVPVWIAGGVYDSHLTFDRVLEMAIMPEQVQITKLQESGHLGMVEERELFIKELNDYLDWVRTEPKAHPS